MHESGVSGFLQRPVASVGLTPTISVVIPAHDAERTIATVLRKLGSEEPSMLEVIVVDDGSIDRTAELARAAGARVVATGGNALAGGARNRGWEEALGDIVVFLDADAIPAPGFNRGLMRALREFPGAIVGCARVFTGRTSWDWVAHLQVETPYLPRGVPREVPFVSSHCMAVPTSAPLRWDESYGGEDALFCADAVAAGLRLVFDPRFNTVHEHGRETFAALRSQQRRLAYGLARCGPLQREGLHKRVFAVFPLHYFTFVRLVLIYRRVRNDARLKRRFLMLLPHLVLAELTLGFSAIRFAVRRPQLRGESRSDTS